MRNRRKEANVRFKRDLWFNVDLVDVVLRVPVSTVRKFFLPIFSLITTLLLDFAYDLLRKQTKISPMPNENMAFFVRVFIAYVSVRQWSRLPAPNEPSRQSL